MASRCVEMSKKYFNEDQRFEFEERAAIMEYEGGLERMKAETAAYEIIIKQNKKKEIVYE